MSNLNPETTYRIDYDAARVRLEAVTSDRDVLEGFERMARNPDDDGAFLTAAPITGDLVDEYFGTPTAPFEKRPGRWGGGFSHQLLAMPRLRRRRGQGLPEPAG